MRGADDLRPGRRATLLTRRPARPPQGPLSLARALSKFGVCSRAEAARWIEQGRVSVDGSVERSPRRRIDPRQSRVEVDGARVRDLQQHLVLALHKPPGYVTTRLEPGGRPTVYDLLGEVGQWVFPVGRLDRDTAGLLIMTNDHRLGQELTDPERHVPRTYHARVRGVPGEEALRVLREGATLEDGTRCRPAVVRALGTARVPPARGLGAEPQSEMERNAGGVSPQGPRAGIHSRRVPPARGLGAEPQSEMERNAGGVSPQGPRAGIHSRRVPPESWLEIVLTEGKNRQVRRMCAGIGHEVVELTRVRIGAFALGELPVGTWRRLEADEVERLRRR